MITKLEVEARRHKRHTTVNLAGLMPLGTRAEVRSVTKQGNIDIEFHDGGISDDSLLEPWSATVYVPGTPSRIKVSVNKQAAKSVATRLPRTFILARDAKPSRSRRLMAIASSDLLSNSLVRAAGPVTKARAVSMTSEATAPANSLTATLATPMFGIIAGTTSGGFLVRGLSASPSGVCNRNDLTPLNNVSASEHGPCPNGFDKIMRFT